MERLDLFRFSSNALDKNDTSSVISTVGRILCLLLGSETCVFCSASPSANLSLLDVTDEQTVRRSSFINVASRRKEFRVAESEISSLIASFWSGACRIQLKDFVAVLMALQYFCGEMCLQHSSQAASSSHPKLLTVASQAASVQGYSVRMTVTWTWTWTWIWTRVHGAVIYTSTNYRLPGTVLDTDIIIYR